MSDCIFCKINKGEIPSYTIYEDDTVRAFLDVFPMGKGHVLVVPKEHYENIFETPDEVLAHINVVCKKVALRLKEKFGADGVNIMNSSGKAAQQTVFHLHYHVLARYENDNNNFSFANKTDYKAELENFFNELV